MYVRVIVRDNSYFSPENSSQDIVDIQDFPWSESSSGRFPNGLGAMLKKYHDQKNPNYKIAITYIEDK